MVVLDAISRAFSNYFKFLLNCSKRKSYLTFDAVDVEFNTTQSIEQLSGVVEIEKDQGKNNYLQLKEG